MEFLAFAYNSCSYRKKNSGSKSRQRMASDFFFFVKYPRLLRVLPVLELSEMKTIKRYFKTNDDHLAIDVNTVIGNHHSPKYWRDISKDKEMASFVELVKKNSNPGYINHLESHFGKSRKRRLTS